MRFQDNVLKEYLKNVYFICGTPCGGKTTVSRELGRRYGIAVYSADDEFSRHQKLSDARFQPSMNKKFKDADEFFGRTVQEYRKWLTDNTREQLEFVILDLIRLSENQKVLCDCDLSVDEADALTKPERVAFLIREPADLMKEYCGRPDHKGFSDYINSATDANCAKAVCGETLKSLNAEKCNGIKGSDYFWLERTDDRTVEETVRKVAAHFGFSERQKG